MIKVKHDPYVFFDNGVIEVGKIFTNLNKAIIKDKRGEFKTEDFTTDVKDRVKKLGLSKLVADDGGISNSFKYKASDISDNLSLNLEEKSKTIQYKITKFNNEDVIKAAEFLEVFLLYAAQNAYLYKEYNNPYTFDDRVKMEGKIYECIKNLEYIQTCVGKKDMKKLIHSDVEVVNRKIHKIMSTYVSVSDKRLFANDIERALKILTKMS